MRRLVIDDLRIMRFPARYARTSAAAIEALADPAGYDEVWFDHDLGGDDTTRPVALWLEEQAFHGRGVAIGRCVVHTDNPVGRDVLRDQLTRVCDDVVVVAARDHLASVIDETSGEET